MRWRVDRDATVRSLYIHSPNATLHIALLECHVGMGGLHISMRACACVSVFWLLVWRDAGTLCDLCSGCDFLVFSPICSCCCLDAVSFFGLPSADSLERLPSAITHSEGEHHSLRLYPSGSITKDSGAPS